jgi:hypothetical protein
LQLPDGNNLCFPLQYRPHFLPQHPMYLGLYINRSQFPGAKWFSELSLSYWSWVTI